MMRHLKAKLFRFALTLLSDTKSTGGRPGKNHFFSRSLKNALRGILYTFLNERNFRFEMVMAVLVIIAGIVFRLSTTEWAIVMSNVFLVLCLEAKNTSLELTTDIATHEYDYNAKSSKDASSGAVLMASLCSVINGLLVFGPHLIDCIKKIAS